MTDLTPVAKCGRYVHGQADFVTVVRSAEGVSTFAGLQTCRSVWACPVCSAAIRQGRAEQVEQVAQAHLQAGGSLAFATFTLPHDRHDALAGLLDDVNGAWKRVQQSRGFRGRREQHGLATVRALEITDGAGARSNGWHPHLHVLLFIDGPMLAPALADLGAYLSDAWAAAVEKTGRRRPSSTHGTRVQPVTLVGGTTGLALYLSKVQDGYGDAWGLGAEVARGDLKAGRRRDRVVPFDHALAAADGDAHAFARWREYETATHGRRCLTWSVGLRERYAVPEVDDQALVEPAGQVIAVYSPQEHELVVRYGRESHVLDLAEWSGADAIYALLRALGRRHEFDQRRAARRAARDPGDVRT